MVKESWDLGIPLFSSQRTGMAGPGLLGIKIKKWPEDLPAITGLLPVL